MKTETPAQPDEIYSSEPKIVPIGYALVQREHFERSLVGPGYVFVREDWIIEPVLN